ncbi:farnesol dehydrogenase-like isoform X2 [Bombyx mori]|uniref:Farnesol dehydrogenase-like n=2 Tax=Bombyx mori TaxID=7091 RepID=A0A8R2C676_BOMMO|nr:farnesol dehydrogenase isoform X3 [Bombyx mori]
MDRWGGKLAVVTGAASGIGAAVAQALDRAGLQVVGLDVKTHVEAKESEIECKGNITSKYCDISKLEDIERVFKWIEDNFGSVYVLVNCAGILYQGQITGVGDNPLSVNQLVETLDVNLKGSILCARTAVECMKKYDISGHIININSLAGHYVPFSSSMNLYASTKYAITAFTETLSQELAHFSNRIKVTSLSPGLTKTEMAAHMDDGLPGLAQSEVADAVLYVLSTPPHINISELTITSVLEKRI